MIELAPTLTDHIGPEQTVLALAPDAALEASLSGLDARRAESARAIGRFVAETIDVVVAAKLTEPGALAEIARVLRPGGRLILGDATQAGPIAAAGFLVARTPSGVLVGVRGEFAASGR